MTNKIQWSGVTASYNHIRNPKKPNPPETPKGLSKQWVLNAQWTDCPKEVQKEVKLLWRLYENGNDRYIIKTTVANLEKKNQDAGKLVDIFDEIEGKRKMVPVTTNAILQYLSENGITDPEEEIIIHYWW